MKIDLICFLVISLSQLFLYSPASHKVLPSDFLYSYNFIIWATISAICFLFYPWLNKKQNRNYLYGLLRLLAIVAVSPIFCFIYSYYNTIGFFDEWQFGMTFYYLPAFIFSIIAYSISFPITKRFLQS
jgi:TRAP-type uncharacterized transport system fused permease subunit